MEHDQGSRRKKYFFKGTDYFNGALVLFKGWDLLEHFRQFPLRIVFIFLVGLAIIVGTALEERIEKRVKNFSGFFHIGEGLALLICATIFLEKGRSRLPVLFFFLGFVMLAMGLTKLLASGASREKTLVLMRLAGGITFIAFAAVMAVVMAISPFYRHPWMYVVVIIFTGAGIFNILMARRRLQEMDAE